MNPPTEWPLPKKNWPRVSTPMYCWPVTPNSLVALSKYVVSRCPLAKLISAVARLSAAKASPSCPLQAAAGVMERALREKAGRGPGHLSSDGGSGRRAN
jgi:hypothetical protein